MSLAMWLLLYTMAGISYVEFLSYVYAKYLSKEGKGFDRLQKFVAFLLWPFLFLSTIFSSFFK